MVWKLRFALGAGIAFLLLTLYSVFIEAHVSTATVLYGGLALLAFAEAAGAWDHQTLRDIEDRDAADRLKARRAGDAVVR